MKRTVSRAERMVTAAGLGLAAAAFLALGVVWHLDRTRRWEPPRWPEPDFVALRSPGANRSAAVPDSASGERETWVVAVNLDCPHCLASLRQTAASRDEQHALVRVATLVVDTRESPPEAAWRTLPSDEVWWDEPQAWRRRWGHRVYGEVLVFAPDGSLRQTRPPTRERAAESVTAPGNEGGHDGR